MGWERLLQKSNLHEKRLYMRAIYEVFDHACYIVCNIHDLIAPLSRYAFMCNRETQFGRNETIDIIYCNLIGP